MSKSKEEIRTAQEAVINKKSAKKTSSSLEEAKDKTEKKSLVEQLGLKSNPQSDDSDIRNPDQSAKAVDSLEEALSKEKIPQFVRESEYTKELSRESVQILYDQAKALVQKAEDKGYWNPVEQRQMEYISGAIEEKVESGEYSFTEETARKASLTLELASKSRVLYKGHETAQKSWYKSG